jgi:transposase
MQAQRTCLDFKGQNIFVGIDVHLKSWAVTIMTDGLAHKTFTQPTNLSERASPAINATQC